MFKLIVTAAIISSLIVSPVRAQSVALGDPLNGQERPSPQQPSRVKEILTDAAIAALLIAASVAAYKAGGRPCACPEDTMRNGRKCGGASAWARPGGAKPLCYAADVTAAMIQAYRSAKVMPPLR